MSGPPGDNGSLGAILARLESAKFDADDHAIVERLVATTGEVERCFGQFEFSAAAQSLYGFFWNDFCDWYVEVSKSKLQDAATRDNSLAIQDLVLRQTLLLLHPFIPFITEELWGLLGYGKPGSLLMRDGRLESARALAESLASSGAAPDAAAAASVETVKTFASQARALKSERGLASRRDVRFLVTTGEGGWATIQANMAKLLRMAGASEIALRESVDGAPAAVTPLGTLYLDLASAVDPAAEMQRLSKELEKLDAHIRGTEARLANPAFAGKAPAAVIDGARKQLAELQAKRAEIDRLLRALR
jgi:valyl-tRNA synthetase